MTHHPERVRLLVGSATGKRPEDVGGDVLGGIRKQIDAAVRARTLRPISPEQFVVNLLALCVFPFAARPLLMAMLSLDERGFERFIARRRTELPAFFLAALRP